MFKTRLKIKNISQGKENEISVLENDYVNGSLLMGLSEGLFKKQEKDCILKINSISDKEVSINIFNNTHSNYFLKKDQKQKIRVNHIIFEIEILSIDQKN